MTESCPTDDSFTLDCDPDQCPLNWAYDAVTGSRPDSTRLAGALRKIGGMYEGWLVPASSQDGPADVQARMLGVAERFAERMGADIDPNRLVQSSLACYKNHCIPPGGLVETERAEEPGSW